MGVFETRTLVRVGSIRRGRDPAGVAIAVSAVRTRTSGSRVSARRVVELDGNRTAAEKRSGVGWEFCHSSRPRLVALDRSAIAVSAVRILGSGLCAVSRGALGVRP